MIQARDLFVSIQILSNLAMLRKGRDCMRDGAILDALKVISNRALSHGAIDCSHYLLQVPCQPAPLGRRRHHSCCRAPPLLAMCGSCFSLSMSPPFTSTRLGLQAMWCCVNSGMSVGEVALW